MRINPPNHDYDIDVGVVFNCTRDDYKPLKLKEMVGDALDALDFGALRPFISMGNALYIELADYYFSLISLSIREIFFQSLKKYRVFTLPQVLPLLY